MSSDRDASKFSSYYSTMPFLALPFSSSSEKNELSKRYNVTGIPTLLVLSPDGSLISNDAKAAVIAGASSFPAPPPPRLAQQGDDSERPVDVVKLKWRPWMSALVLLLLLLLFLLWWRMLLAGSSLNGCPESAWTASEVDLFLRVSGVPGPTVSSIASANLSGKDVLLGELGAASKRLALLCHDPIEPCVKGLEMLEQVSERFMAEIAGRCNTYLTARSSWASPFIVATAIYFVGVPVVVGTAISSWCVLWFVTLNTSHLEALSREKSLLGSLLGIVAVVASQFMFAIFVVVLVIGLLLCGIVLPIMIREWHWVSDNLGVWWNIVSICTALLLFALVSWCCKGYSDYSSKRRCEDERKKKEEDIAVTAAAAKGASWQAALEAEVKNNSIIQMEREANAKKVAAEKAAAESPASGKKTKKSNWLFGSYSKEE